MNLQDMMYNRKGFIHHPETPAEDKEFYNYHKGKARHLLQIGKAFIDSEGVLSYRSAPHGKEELSTSSKFLHRGVYCPSPVLDILITNSSRGRILVKPTDRSHITNRYVYDASGKLSFLDNYIEDKMVSSEYLVYQDNLIYGITVGMGGKILSVSEEKYTNRVLENYICAFYAEDGTGLNCLQMDCEQYIYDQCGLLDWNYYQLYYSWENVAPSGFIEHKRYRFARENGMLKSFFRVNNDGTPFVGSTVNEIKLKRKAW